MSTLTFHEKAKSLINTQSKSAEKQDTFLSNLRNDRPPHAQ
jgi:hypothetical protein